MLLWPGLVLSVGGLACLAVDRRASHALHEHVRVGFWHLLDATTHAAKASHWLIVAGAAFVVGEVSRRLWGENADLELIRQCALAFVASLAAGSLVLHGIKLVLGRRRPRDDFEMGLYGFMPLSFDLQYNSFPSGHALTIMCVAVVASAAWPQFALLWFALALWLALTRALLTAHYLSDVFVGAGIGLISAREIVVHVFPQLAPSWF